MTPLLISFNPQSCPHRVVDRCRQCRELDNQARARDDFTLYRAMLKTIRHTEEGYKDNSHVIFLLQVVCYCRYNNYYYRGCLITGDQCDAHCMHMLSLFSLILSHVYAR